MFFHRHSALSHRQHDDDLGNDDAQEHAERIDRGVGNGGFVARQSVVDIVEGDGVGHRATEHTGRGGETLATPLHGDDADDDDDVFDIPLYPIPRTPSPSSPPSRL